MQTKRADPYLPRSRFTAGGSSTCSVSLVHKSSGALMALAERCLRRSGQRGAEPAGGYPHLTAERLGQMALVGKPDLLGNQGEGLAGLPQ